MSTANTRPSRFVPTVRNRAKAIAIALMVSALAASSVFAADSVCMLGDNGKIALSTFEHRSGTGDGRVTEVTLIFGMHLLRGRLIDTDSGPVTLKEAAGKDSYSFRGTIGVNYQTKKMTVKGQIKSGNLEVSNINSTFRGKELNP